MALDLAWRTCGKGDDKHWCNLKNLTLPLNDDPEGVYIIWHTGDPGKVVYVGQGDISDRLAKHRKDKAILAYSKQGTLHVTWATVRESQLDGVERHLADHFDPLVGDVFPDVRPIAVNVPW